MEMTTRALWALIRGMGFGGFYLLACSGALVEIWRGYSPSAQAAPSPAGMKPFFASIWQA